MRQALHVRLLAVLVIGVLLPSPGFGATGSPDDATISTQPLPGGLNAARAAAGDRRQADAGQFLVDAIRRSFQVPAGTRALRREGVLRPLIDHLEMVQKSGVAGASDQWPLPLTPAVWTQSILGEHQASGSLLAAILRSPSASLMYCALLSLDDPTRAWLASEPALLQHIAQRRAAQFLLAAPGLRVRDAAVQVTGGAAAVPAWEAAVGKRVSDPVGFVRAIVDANGPGLPYFVGGAAQLAPERIRLLLAVDAAPATAASAVRRLAIVFDRIASAWDVDEKPFWRPTLDPLLLVSDLRLNANGAPVLPGTIPFWMAAFSGGGERALSADAVSSTVSGPPADFPWICEQVFVGGQTVLRGPYHLVLLASRRFPSVTAANAVDALALLRGAGQFPALVGTLERARVEPLRVYADVVSRARQLTAIDDEPRARVALAQFQGALALLARAAARGTLNPAEAAPLISSLSAVAPDERGEYRGKLVEWIAATVTSHGAARGAALGQAVAADLDWNFVRFISGADERGPVVEWEGTPYRISFGAAEATRFRQLLGEHAPPYLSAAGTMAAAAEAFEGEKAMKPAIADHADAVGKAAAAVKCDENKADAWPMLGIGGRCRELAAAVTRAATTGDARNAARLAPRLRQLADLLLARGLTVLTYAAAMGHRDNAVVSPEDAASRHDFGFDFPGYGRGGAWRWPASGADRIRNWHVTGAMLGLDTALAQFTLVRTTTRPPSARPSLTEEDKVIFIKSAALIHPGTLTADDHHALVAAVRRGRERLANVRTRDEAAAIGDELALPPLMRTLLAWNATFDARRALDVLTLSHVFLLGLEPAADPARFDAWGVAVDTRSGCHCLQFPGRRAGDLLPGRWFGGVLATGFADLNLRLAELLDEVRMPGALLAPVLAAATSDFTLGVEMRDFDDVPGWSDYTKALDIDRIEQYLALLTTDGALVPVTEGSSLR
jgi:hypothetical protein